MKPIDEFTGKFGAHLSLEKSLIAENKNGYFLLNEELKHLVGKDFFYAGTYIGKSKSGQFFPSFILLKMIAEKKANKIVVDAKAAWLFICGRYIFKRGIVQVEGSKKKDAYTLVLNQHSECLGFGKIVYDLDGEKGRVAVKNILDIGDFLRREK
jgi:ribosome biogenesis protein Nip4